MTHTTQHSASAFYAQMQHTLPKTTIIYITYKQLQTLGHPPCNMRYGIKQEQAKSVGDISARRSALTAWPHYLPGTHVFYFHSVDSKIDRPLTCSEHGITVWAPLFLKRPAQTLRRFVKGVSAEKYKVCNGRSQLFPG